MSTQQQANAGDNARIIQIIGDNNFVGDSPHLFICPLPSVRSVPAGPAKDEASLLRPVVEATAFAGREQLLADFIAWATVHEATRPVSLRVVHGGAGVGKTRFALELCRALGSEWQAGFVPGKEAQRALGKGNLGAWEWRKPTLIVFDYALSLVETLRVWLEELCAATPRAHPLRILLLERQADAQAGWLERLFQGGFGLSETMPRELLDGEPLRLPDLSSPAVRIGIMQNMLARLGSAVALPADDADFQARLAATDWAGAPLYLMMAAMVMHQRGGVGEVLHLGRVDLAQFVAEHEHKRLLLPCGDNASMQILIAHMAAFATLRGGIGARELSPCLAREREALGCDSGDVAKARRLLSDLLPDGGEGVAPIQPDIVGEAFLLSRLADGRQTEGMDAVFRAFGDRPSEVAAVLVRCVQDFAPRARTDASGRASTAGNQAMAWLGALGDIPELPLQTLFVLADALPEDTAALRAVASDWQSRVVVQLRQRQNDSMDYRVVLAGSLNTLAKRLCDTGQRQDALEIAMEATALYSQLADASPDAFRPNLALSLNNLAARLSDAGQRQDALEIAMEATALYHQLADANPDAFRPNFAMSLNNLATMLSGAGQRQNALVIALKATALNRQLADANPEAFRPSLAMSLNNLASRLSDAGQRQDALEIAMEAVAIRLQLAEANPDAFQSYLAASLNNLANRLSELGQRQEALTIAQEAARLYRELADANPDAFRPDLAGALNNLANRLSDVERRQEALKIAREAVTIHRALADANPETFRPDLAMSLNNLAVRLSDARQHQEALKIAREAVTIRRELANANPDAFRPDLALSLNNFANRLKDSGYPQEALKIAWEAVDIRRELADANPDAFRPNLALSLNNLANRLIDTGQPLEALPIARESARLYITLASQLPEVFGQNATIATCEWLSLRHDISREEAAALLQQNPQAHIDALFDDSDESSPSDTSTPPQGATPWT